MSYWSSSKNGEGQQRGKRIITTPRVWEAARWSILGSSLYMLKSPTKIRLFADFLESVALLHSDNRSADSPANLPPKSGSGCTRNERSSVNWTILSNVLYISPQSFWGLLQETRKKAIAGEIARFICGDMGPSWIAPHEEIYRWYWGEGYGIWNTFKLVWTNYVPVWIHSNLIFLKKWQLESLLFLWCP